MPAALSTEFAVTTIWAIWASLIAGEAAAAGLVVSGAGATAGSGGVGGRVLGLLAAGQSNGGSNRGERTANATVSQTGGRHGFWLLRVVDFGAAL
jgi:uncharacterized Ntn-hydrolase superfamily protein